ncbi:MAG: hypothetical protein R3330_08265, partial [Saprospiraceae bacterium]|nr:hypothetical protein [Saprospiraceae bacterium]
LDQLLRPDTTGKARITARTASLLNEVVMRLLQLSGQYRNRAEFLETHNLLRSTITRLHQLLDKQGVPHPALRERLIEAYEELRALTQLPLAPELRASIYQYGLALVSMSYHRIYHPSHNMPGVMPLVIEDHDQPGPLMEAIREKVRTRLDTQTWAMLYYLTAAGLRLDTFRRLELSPERIHPVLLMLVDQRQQTALELCIRHYYDAEHLTADLGLQWSRWMLDGALERSDALEALHWGMEHMRYTPEQDVLHDIVTVLERSGSAKDLHARVMQSGDTRLTGALLATLGRWDELLTLISEQGSLKVLTDHLKALLAAVPGPTREIIPSVMMHYASHHAGIACGEQVEAFLSELADSSAHDLASDMRAALRASFPGRFPIIPSGVEIS